MRDIKETITDLEYAIARYGRENSFTLAAHAALKCLKEMQRERAWRPIETAPKDDRQILVWTGTSAEKVYFDTELKKWCEAWDGDEDFHDLCAPTHWMPLPPPPTDTAAH